MFNLIKKIVRWTPIVTLCMVFAMYIGMRGYNGDGYGYGNDQWVARRSTTFGSNDFMALIGHGSWKHYLGNAATFICYFTAIELLLVKKWKAILAAISMMGIWLTVEEVFFQIRGIGASGWIMSIPGFLILTAAWRANKGVGLNNGLDFVVRRADGTAYTIPMDEEVSQKFAAMLMPFVVFGLNLLLAWEDVKGLKNSFSTTSHEGHLIGAGISIAMALVAIAIYLPKWIGQLIREWKAERAWKQRCVAFERR